MDFNIDYAQKEYSCEIDMNSDVNNMFSDSM